ncbi:hypothetical protein [Burkholderia cenocepacia]|uniref:hypothetical protein n=1 Tax=Burkholderia cenocepacia TaxID=95486 RepID=UPI001BA7D7A0|nr:hypothetical protein [Burkholderia cenocepacia]
MQHPSWRGDAAARRLRSADHGGLGRATQREWLARAAYPRADRREATGVVARYPQAGRQTLDDAGDASWSAADRQCPKDS